VHGVNTPSYDSALGDEERRCAVWSTTNGKSGVFLSFAGVLWHDGVETEGLVEERTKELEIFELFEGRVSTVKAGDFGL
jgi:hypothetical protein